MNDKTEDKKAASDPEAAKAPAPETEAKTESAAAKPAAAKKKKTVATEAPRYQLLADHKLDTFREAGEKVTWAGRPSRFLKPLNAAARDMIKAVYDDKHLKKVLDD